MWPFGGVKQCTCACETCACVLDIYLDGAAIAFDVPYDQVTQQQFCSFMKRLATLLDSAQGRHAVVEQLAWQMRREREAGAEVGGAAISVPPAEGDLYREGAAIWLGVTYDQVTRTQRQAFKERCFWLIYRRGATNESVRELVHGLARSMRQDTP